MSNAKAQDKNSIFNLTIRLLIITVVAGLILGLVYTVTKDPIEQQEVKRATEARKMVLPEAADFEPIAIDGIDYDKEAYADVTDAYTGTTNGEVVGYTVGIITKGYKPGLTLTIGVSTDGVITGVAIGSHEETPGLGANAVNPEFLDQFIGADGPIAVGKSPTGALNEIQALTGATITSRAVAHAADTAREFCEEYLMGGA